MVKSIYDKDPEMYSIILSSETNSPFIIQKEEVHMFGDITILDVVYTETGFFIGDLEQKDWLIETGITEQIQSYSGNLNCTGSIGFNPTEQKWFAWSHRSMYGFGIGSEVKNGDCAYKPKNIKDFNESLLEFWDIDGSWRECETPDIICATRLLSITSNVTDEDYPGQQGTRIEKETIFKGVKNRDVVSVIFTPYPKVWGRGCWTALTLDDAKEMAIDFAKGVS
jgi:hypothetical protein